MGGKIDPRTRGTQPTTVHRDPAASRAGQDAPGRGVK